MNSATLIRPTLVKHYSLHGHPVTVECERGHCADEPDATSLKCPECSLPFVVAQCVLLMATHNIQKMTVDGAVIEFSHTTVKAA